MPIEDWLRAIGLGAVVQNFEERDIDLDIVSDLSESDLREIGLTLGQRKRFLRAVQALNDEPLPSSPSAVETAPKQLAADRRHLTVMFCDMVGSTALSERLEPEDLLQVVQSYQDCCTSIVIGYDGYVARYLGDGILVYFGFPMAHEAAPEQALRAALKIVEEIPRLKLPGDIKLQIRIGIASGVVVVGDLLRSGPKIEQPAIGVAPNLAARLQGLAAPDQIVVADVTYRLTQSSFDFEDLGERTLAGISRPVRAWGLTGEARRRDLAAALGQSQQTTFTNRREPLKAMRGCWQEVRQGQGRAILLSGEPGIGKSCLLHHFLSTIEEKAALQIYNGSLHNQDSPLHPIIQWLRASGSIERDNDAAAIRSKLEPLMPDRGPERAAEREEWLDLLTALLSPIEVDSGLGTAGAKQIRERTLAAMIAALVALSEVRPVIMVVEDHQWLDATSVELLDRVVRTIDRHPILVLITSRLGLDGLWDDLDNVRNIELERLAPEDSRELIDKVAGGAGLPRSMISEIIERTDGIPLFVEEFTKSVIEHDAEKPSDGGEAPSESGAARVPVSLHDSLMERLDRVGSAKRVARVGAVLGRTFTRELLRQTGEFEPVWLDTALNQLLEAGLLLRRVDQSGRERFVFKHALVQDTAYSSILREYRRHLHARAADALEAIAPGIAEERPDLLAQHVTEAGKPERAVELWLQAGRRGVAQSAIVEAANHLQRGLEALRQLPAGDQMRRLQLQILNLLGPASIALHGPGSPEAQKVYAEGYAICHELPETQDHFPIYWGWWRLSRDFNQMNHRADELLKRAMVHSDEELLLQAHHCQWASHFNRGDFSGCQEHIGWGLKLYEQGDYRSHATLYGNHDAKVCGHGEQALVAWLLGRPEAALESERRAVAWAQTLDHVGSSMHLKDIALTHRLYRRDAREVLRHADGMIVFAEEQGFTDHRAKALVYRGWAKATLGEPAAGLAELELGLEQQKAIGTSEDFPIYYDMYAEVLALNGRYDHALEEILEREREFERAGLRIWAPEMRRRRGQLLEESSPQDLAPAIAAYREALELAQHQGARMLVLRASVSLAKTLTAEGEAAEVRSILEPWIEQPELVDTPEYAAARSQMDKTGRKTDRRNGA